MSVSVPFGYLLLDALYQNAGRPAETVYWSSLRSAADEGKFSGQFLWKQVRIGPFVVYLDSLCWQLCSFACCHWVNRLLRGLYKQDPMYENFIRRVAFLDGRP